MENKMDKNRMQKLAGIKEGTSFKDGKFKLDRFDVWQSQSNNQDSWTSSSMTKNPALDDEIMKEVDPDGDFCDSIQVSKLEELANEMYDALDDIIGEAGFEGLPDSKQDAIYAVIAKAKSL
jgi:hypothetical protein